MSCVVNVVHESRYVDYVLNFPATENTLAWPIVAEADGQIYEAILTNVASYTIAGSAPSLPQAVTGGSSYAIAITKTTNGQTASITLRARRTSNKTVSASVPDLNQFNGRYYFALMSNNVLVKLDPDLLIASNYEGNGVWTVNPGINTLTLPTLATNQWQCIHHVNGKILAVAIKGINTSSASFILVDPVTMAYTNLDGIANQYTTINTSLVNPCVTICYNYIHNTAIINNAIINFNNKEISPTNVAALGPFSATNNPNYSKLLSFNPNNYTYSSIGDIIYNGEYAINFKNNSTFNNSPLAGFAYIPTNGYTAARFGNQLRSYGINGGFIETRSFNELITNLFNTKHLEGNKIIAYSYGSTTRYIYFSNPTTYTLIDYATISGYETNMYLIDFAASRYKQTAILRNNLAGSKRLFVFNYNAETYTGYLDLAERPISICSNQYV